MPLIAVSSLAVSGAILLVVISRLSDAGRRSRLDDRAKSHSAAAFKASADDRYTEEAGVGPEKSDGVKTDRGARQILSGEPPMTQDDRFAGRQDTFLIAVVSRDGNHVLSSSEEKTMILWDRESAGQIRRFPELGGRVLSVAFSPDGRRGLSGGDDRGRPALEPRIGRCGRQVPGPYRFGLQRRVLPRRRLAYSSSGGFPRAGWQDGTDSAIRVWDIETQQEMHELWGHKGIVWSVAVSPDGNYVLSGGAT